MATASVSKQQVWNINDMHRVCVYNVCPENTESNVVLDCFETDKQHVVLKSRKKSHKTYVQFPVPSYRQTHSKEMLRERFQDILNPKEFLNCNENKIGISIDNLKTWSKKEFCEVLLSKFLKYARSSTRRQSDRVTLAFCALESSNFEKACEVCKSSGMLEEKATKQSGHNLGSDRNNKMSNALSITVEEGTLDKTKADALACTMSSDLDLKRGAVSNALLTKSGEELQRNLDRKCPDQNLDFGSVVAVSAPNLDCRCVLFGVMYPFNENHTTDRPEDYYRATVHDFVKACLEYAENNRFRSIAFPAVGTGILQFPLHIVADQMLTTVMNWSEDPGSVWLKDVRFVIYPKDKESVKAFQEAKGRYGTNKRGQHVKTWRQLKCPDGLSASLSKKKYKCSIPKGYTAELVQLYCEDTIDNLKSCDCEVDIKGDEIIIKGPEDVLGEAGAKMQTALEKVEKAFPEKDFIDMSVSNFNQCDYKRYFDDIKSAFNVDFFVDTVKKKVAVFGKDLKELAKAKEKMRQFFPDIKRSETDNSRDLQQITSRTGSSSGNRQSISPPNSSQLKPVEAVYETKEKVTVKVYSADIFSVPVDCIVSATDVRLAHEGGIAKGIAPSAGKELTKEGRDILKKHGKLEVGKACSTGPGKLHFKCVVHTLGPCWKDYYPYTLSDVDKCKTDLYHAVINSLVEAEKKTMQTVAVSSISSGRHGCPLDLCCVQYARAVTDYSKLARHPLKEIHFVDLNWQTVQMMQATFQSMIYDEKVPKFYDDLAHGSEASVYGKQAFKETNVNVSQKDSKKDQKKSGKSSPNYRGSNLIVYPYCFQDYPPGQKQTAFTCCLGPNQNLFVYTTDILSMTGIDIIVCGNIQNGNSKGRLANAILRQGGDTYKKEKEKAFRFDAAKGSVVACSTGNWRFKWVVHAILVKIKDTKDEKDREYKVTKIFHNIFCTLRNKRCRSMALPLIGTGFGKADPVYYANRCIDGLLEFCSFNKEYPFNIHIVHDEEGKTEIVKKAVGRAVRDTIPLSRQSSQYKQKKKTLTDQPKRPPLRFSNQENHTGYVSSAPESKSSHGRNNSKRNDIYSSTKAKYKEHSEVGKTFENIPHEVSTPRESVNGNEKVNVTETKYLREKFQKNDVTGSDTDEDEEYETMTDQNGASYAKLPTGNLKVFNVDDSEHQFSNDESNTDISEEEKEASSDTEELETEVNEQIVDEEEEEREDEKETCVICMDEITDPHALPCGHVFCTNCIEAHFTYKEACPTCGKVCGIIKGDQPEGKMNIDTNEKTCAGFDGCGRIEITYTFPDGRQRDDHPSPGTWYKGITRKAYLPNNSKGKQICAMLKVAFERKLVFTIGRSRTTGADGVITWNDIHHKTDPRPNSQFGYPDPTYLDRVTEELEIKGVTINDIPALSVARKKRR